MPSTTATRKARRDAGQKRSERTIMGVPARFMGPRLVLLVCVVFLALFGLLMIYSSSSITAMSSSAYNNDPAYFLKNQARYLAVGVVFAVVIASQDYHLWSRGTIFHVLLAGVGVLLLLVETPFAGQDIYGASRWLSLGGFSLQPSELAKPVLILAAANIGGRFFEEGSLDRQAALVRFLLFIGLPLGLILLQPDKGTTLIIAITVLVMAAIAGLPRRYILGIIAVGLVAVLFMTFKDDYSRQRFMTMIDPWSDPYDSGYQLIQGWYAFGSGGLFGVGIGYSHQKYAYLPMAYNDFIFAIVGEECGLVGTVAVIALFLVMLYASYRIANYAPDLSGRLIACGCSTLLVVQLLVNVGGVLGLIPLSGKPVPFLSYGGSSIISCCMLVGLIFSVSRSSILPVTEHDRRRSRIRVADEPSAADADGVGPVMTRSESRLKDAGRGFTVVEGGRSGRAGAADDARAHAAERAARRAERRERTDLTDPASRLRRPDTGPVVRTRTASPKLDGRSSGRARRPRRGR